MEWGERGQQEEHVSSVCCFFPASLTLGVVQPTLFVVWIIIPGFGFSQYMYIQTLARRKQREKRGSRTGTRNSEEQTKKFSPHGTYLLTELLLFFCAS